MTPSPLTDPALTFVPDAAPLVPETFARVTHLCIAAHQDDLEIMAYPAIEECYQNKDAWFGGVVITDGGGSSRRGPYADYSDEEMRSVRAHEQIKAARMGEYGFVCQLAVPSADVKQGTEADSARRVAGQLAAIVDATRPRELIMHHFADKHDTHIACAWRTLEALRSLPREHRPERILGAEVWRGLDWMLDAEKIALDCSRRPALAAALLGVFDSQITGGKRYDLAAAGRRLANATFFDSHSGDESTALNYSMDLTPLVRDGWLDPVQYTLEALDRLKADVESRARRFGG